MKKSPLLTLFFLLLLNPCFGKDYFIVGNKEGESELIYPRQIKEGPNGNIYVYDSRDAFIKVYSQKGKYLRKIGGKGQGPGEIQRVDSLSFGFTYDKRFLFFTEFWGGHKWITFMELSGKFHKAMKLKMEKMYGVLNSASLKNREFLIEISFSDIPERSKDHFLYRNPHSLVKINSKGRIVSEILRTSNIVRISFEKMGADSPIPFTPNFIWIPYKNETIVFSDGLSRSLKVYNHQGKLIRKIKTPIPEPEKVTKKDLDKWKKRRKEAFSHRAGGVEWYKRFGKVIEKYKKSIYKKKPNLSDMSATPDGNILLCSPRKENKKLDYWLINKNGKVLVKIKSNASISKISKHFIFFKIVDEEENTLVCCLKRRGTEIDDLLNLKNQLK